MESDGDPTSGTPEVDADERAERFRLARDGALLLQPNGFRVIEPRRRKRAPVHAYDEITHVYVSDRHLLIGTDRDLLSIRDGDFLDPDRGPAAARRALLARIATTPEGAAAFKRFEGVDRLGERSGPDWVVWLTVVLCLVGTGLQLAEPNLEQIAAFLPDLFERGEFWRAITTHFFHSLTLMPGLLRPLLPMFTFLPIHLAVNVGGLLVLGHLVERPLGSWRTAIVIATSAVGSVAGILVFGHLNVVGASGIVAGLAGAMLALELHFARVLPVYWRLPRRLFITVLVLQFGVIDQVFSAYLAGGAHLGGFAGGYLAARSLGPPTEEIRRPTPSLQLGTLCAAALVVVGIAGAWPLARNDMRALERHAIRLFDSPDALHLYEHDNAAAWLIATEGGATAEGLDLAVALADRAAQSTRRFHPGILDTLAEALFQRGDRIEALFVIDEAIRLAPHEPYFYEQRRRFIGARAADDRPQPPGSVIPDESGRDREHVPLIDPDAPRLTI